MGVSQVKPAQNCTVRRAFLAVAVLLTVLTFAQPVAAQTAANVLLVINKDNPASIEVGEYYAGLRRLPATNIVRINTAQTDSISRAAYEATIQAPIAKWLTQHLLQDQILYIVLTRGIPLRIDGTGGRTGTISSVDSELTLLYRRMTGAQVGVAGQVDNPFFLGDKPMTAAKRFGRETSDLFLVTRLDGFAFDDVKALIDRGIAPSRDGRIVLDQKATIIDRGGDSWMAEAAERLRAGPEASRVVLEPTTSLASTTDPVLGYFSWGSNDPANQLRRTGLRFVPGAIGGMFVSTDGRTFREPSPVWKPAPAGSTTGGQSLIGDLIREGITGISGHVSEPYLDSIIRPQVLFPAYLAGFNLAEAFYLAMPYLSWQDIVIGDPLCSPFGNVQTHASAPIDPETALPRWFSERTLAVARNSPLKLEGIKINLKALSLQAQGKAENEYRPLLEQATAIEPRIVGAQSQLAQFADARGDWKEAITRYRAVIASDASNVIAHNNLAYLLAERNELAEALPLAERAYRMAPQLPFIADTLGWIHYLRGDYAAARPLLERALAGDAANVDILVHNASLALAFKDLARAKTLLDSAVKSNPDAANRDDVKALRAKIK